MDPTILISENDSELTDLYKTYLSHNGYRVRIATGGVECLWAIRNVSPDVIVASVDIKWGGADGLVGYLCDEYRDAESPFVILTGCTAEENVAALCKHPCVFRYLRKPFLMGRLLDCIRGITGEGRSKPRSASPVLPPLVASLSDRFTHDGLLRQSRLGVAK